MHIVFANVIKVSPRRSATLILLLLAEAVAVELHLKNRMNAAFNIPCAPIMPSNMPPKKRIP